MRREGREGGEEPRQRAGGRGVKLTEHITPCCGCLGAGITTRACALPAHKQQPKAPAQPEGQEGEQGCAGTLLAEAHLFCFFFSVL